MAEANHGQWRVVQNLPARVAQPLAKVVAQLRLLFAAARDGRQSVLCEHHKDFDSDETPRPLHCVDERIDPPVSNLIRHISGLGGESAADGCAVTAEKHASARWHREPFMRVASDGISPLDARKHGL